MIKIGEAAGMAAVVSEIPGRDERKTGDAGRGEFKVKLNQAEGDCRKERVKNLAEAIFKQGEKLGRKTDIRELKLYKQLISEFMQEAVSSSLEFSKENFLDRRGRYKVQAVVKKVSEELDNLTKDVLSSQKDNLRILQRLLDIRGMIVDLLL